MKMKLIQRNVLPTENNKEIKLIIYLNEFKTSNLVINNNFSPSIDAKKETLYINLKCIRWFNLNYFVESTHHASFGYQMNTTYLYLYRLSP